MTDLKILGVIPARYASTRFPAKALADIGGKPMIQRVYEQAKKASLLTDVVIATDHHKILNVCAQFGGQACLTAEAHTSGTDRCFEALSQQVQQYHFVINIQGDEPFIDPGQIDMVAQLLERETELATLIKRIEGQEELFDPNVVKVVINKHAEAIYFSRSTIPYLRNAEKNKWLDTHNFYKHIGIYGYRSDILQAITELEASSLETAESLEQLRWIENGFKIKVAETPLQSIGVDTPADLEKLKHLY